MKITQSNLNEIIFENQDAKLLIEDVASHTSINLYYYHDTEITVKKALDIWYKAMTIKGGESGYYSVSFIDFNKNKAPEYLCS